MSNGLVRYRVLYEQLSSFSNLKIFYYLLGSIAADEKSAVSPNRHSDLKKKNARFVFSLGQF